VEEISDEQEPATGPEATEGGTEMSTEAWAEVITDVNGDPEVRVHNISPPSMDQFLFTRKRVKGGALYWGEKNGFVHFFYYSGPSEGYGGRTFSIRMDDGTVAELHGPWSSRSAVMNDAGFPPCVEVVVERGSGSLYATAMLVSALADMGVSIDPPTEAGE